MSVIHRNFKGRKARSISILPLLLLALLPLSSCAPKEQVQRVQLPSTPVLSVRSSWGVIRSNLLRVREEPLKGSRTLTHLRRGTVMEILSQTDQKEFIDNETSYWYEVNYAGVRGWVFGAYLEILDSKAKAEAFAAGLQ